MPEGLAKRRGAENDRNSDSFGAYEYGIGLPVAANEDS
jgi:hypothetical protein